MIDRGTAVPLESVRARCDEDRILPVLLSAHAQAKEIERLSAELQRLRQDNELLRAALIVASGAINAGLEA